MAEKEACVLCAEIAVLLAKIVIDPVPPAKIEVFLQPLLHCTKGKWWVETNPRSMCSKSGHTLNPVQDIDAETDSDMRSPTGLVHSDRPKGRILPCLDSTSTQTVSLVFF